MTTDCSIHDYSKLKSGENMLCTEIVSDIQIYLYVRTNLMHPFGGENSHTIGSVTLFFYL